MQQYVLFRSISSLYRATRSPEQTTLTIFVRHPSAEKLRRGPFRLDRRGIDVLILRCLLSLFDALRSECIFAIQITTNTFIFIDWSHQYERVQ